MNPIRISTVLSTLAILLTGQAVSSSPHPGLSVFVPQVTLGNIFSAGLFVITVVTAWKNMDKRLALSEQRDRNGEQARREQAEATKELRRVAQDAREMVVELRATTRDMNHRIRRLEDRVG